MTVATAKKLPSGKWRCLAYVGKEVTKSGYKSFTAATKKEAERLALAFEDEHKSGKVTVQEAMTRYINSRSNTLSPATIKAYDSILRNRLRAIMSMDIAGLTPEALQAAFDAEVRAGASPKTQRNIHGLLTASARMFGVTLPPVKLQDKAKKERDIPTPQQVKQMLDATEGDFHMAILLAADLGLSRSEICALTMADCQGGRVRINKAVVQDKGNEWVVKQPKETSRYRQIPMTPAVKAALSALDRPPAEKVVHLPPSVISDRFTRLCKHLFGRTFGFHALRHYNVSLMLAAGVKPKYIIDRTGHATMHMVDTVYGHIMQDEKDAEAEMFNRFVAKL